MKLIGFKAEEIAGVYTLLGAILHLGNVQFRDVFLDGMDTVDVLNEEGELNSYTDQFYHNHFLDSYGILCVFPR